MLASRPILPVGYRRLLHAAAEWWLNTLHPAHIHHSDRRARRRRTLAELLDLPGRKRTSGILRQRRLLPVERDRRRRGRGAGHYRSAEHVIRRARRVGPIWTRAENAFSLWCYRRRRYHLHRSELRRRHPTRLLRHPASTGECVLGNRCDAILDSLVHISDVGNRPVIRIPAVVIVVNDGVVDHRVGIVYPRKITLAHLVRREVWLTRPQREPAYCGCGTNRKTHAEARPASSSAYPTHQSRSIEGRYPRRSRYPTPASTKRSPTSIVIGSESPWRFVHPGPAPGCDPCPMPVVIGRPIRGDRRRHPHLSIARLIRPPSVLI